MHLFVEETDHMNSKYLQEILTDFIGKQLQPVFF